MRTVDYGLRDTANGRIVDGTGENVIQTVAASARSARKRSFTMLTWKRTLPHPAAVSDRHGTCRHSPQASLEVY